MSRVLLLRNCIELEGDRVKVNLPKDDKGYYLPLQPSDILKKANIEGDLILSSYGPDWTHRPLYDLVFFVTEQGLDLGLVESGLPETEIIDLDAPSVQRRFLFQLQKAGYYSKAKPRYRLFGKRFFEDLKGQGFEYPLLVDVKVDGLRISLGKEDGKPFIWVDPEDLKRKSPDCTDRFPAIVKDLEKLPNDTILDGEFIAVRGNKALHRTVANALMNSKAAPEDLSPWAAIFVFDILKYDGKDLRDLSLSERLEYLKKLPKFDHIVVEEVSEKLDGKHPAYIVHSDKELEKAIDLIRDSKTGIWEKAAEGVMIKKLDHPYEVPQNRGWSKTKWLHEADVVVLARKLVKGQTDVWNYELGISITEDYARKIPVQRLACIDGDEAYFGTEAKERFGKQKVEWFMRFGKSDNTRLDLKTGEVLRVAPEEVLEEPNEEYPDYPVYRGYISIALEPVPEKDRSDDLKVFERLAEEEPQRISIEELKRLRQSVEKC